MDLVAELVVLTMKSLTLPGVATVLSPTFLPEVAQGDLDLKAYLLVNLLPQLTLTSSTIGDPPAPLLVRPHPKSPRTNAEARVFEAQMRDRRVLLIRKIRGQKVANSNHPVLLRNALPVPDLEAFEEALLARPILLARQKRTTGDGPVGQFRETARHVSRTSTFLSPLLIVIVANNSTPPTPQLSRRKLELLPRSNATSAVPSPLSSPNPSHAVPASRPNPFGAARYIFSFPLFR